MPGKATNEDILDTEVGKIASIVSDELKGISGANHRQLADPAFFFVRLEN